MHDRVVGLHGPGQRAGTAAQYAVAPFEARRRSIGIEPGNRDDRFGAGDTLEQRIPGRGRGTPQQVDGDGGGLQERQWRQYPAQFLGQHAQFHRTEPEAAELFRHGRTGPPELADLAPQRAVERHGTVDLGPQAFERHGLGQVTPGIVAQHLLLF
jgi:hypothetical protein